MSAVDGSAVQQIANLAQVQEFVLSGDQSLDKREHKFTTESLVEMKPAPPPVPHKMVVTTLDGLVELIRQKIEGITPEQFAADYLLQVDNEAHVTLLAKKTDEYGRRVELASAKPVEFQKYQFGQWIPQEQFCIAVQALFADTDDKAYVLRIAGSITNEEVVIAEDNGFSQNVTLKAGMKLQEVVTLKPQVLLAPYRTFPECQQPISAFVFRARKEESGGPKLMLVEADGGKWKIAAMREINRYLDVLVPGVEIIS